MIYELSVNFYENIKEFTLSEFGVTPIIALLNTVFFPIVLLFKLLKPLHPYFIGVFFLFVGLLKIAWAVIIGVISLGKVGSLKDASEINTTSIVVIINFIESDIIAYKSKRDQLYSEIKVKYDINDSISCVLHIHQLFNHALIMQGVEADSLNLETIPETITNSSKRIYEAILADHQTIVADEFEDVPF